jgi:PAS domain S-box-containing protein
MSMINSLHTPANNQFEDSFYKDLIANSLDGMVLTNETGIISFVSSSVKKLTAYEMYELIGQSVFEFIHPHDKPIAEKAFADELNYQQLLNFITIRIRKKDNTWIWCMVRGHNLISNPAIGQMVIYFYDDTRRKQTEDALIQSENRFRRLIHNLTQGVMLINAEFEIEICNPAALKMMGLKEVDILGKKINDPGWEVVDEYGKLLSSSNRPVYLAINSKKPVKDVVIGIRHENSNERLWLIMNTEPIMDSTGRKVINIICSFVDITEQRKLSQQQIEQEILKQKLITQATIDGQEKERSQIGKELHDNINQHLNTTRLFLEIAQEKNDPVQMLEMVNLAYKDLSNIINEIRLLSQSLVPPTLGDLGLIESTQDIIDSLKRTHKFKISFYHKHFHEENLPDNLKLTLFRIIQEQVNNIVRHSNAQAITIQLQTDAENIILMIRDNGKGFEPANIKKGQGLANIRNRAELFNGRVEIDSAPGSGCTLSVTIPQLNEAILETQF